MHEVTQQRIDESDLKIAKTFQNTGLSQNASIVLVTMLQFNKPEINQTEIAIMSGLPQGVVSKGVNELVNREWVTVGDAVPSEGKGRPTRIYKAISINIIVKDMIEHFKTYNATVNTDIATIKETYK
jgi:predicted transcriptional regulator